MKKRVIKWNGQNYFYLGKTKKGQEYWLREASWSCDWYWSFGGIVTFTNKKNPEKSTDTSIWTHWDIEFPVWSDYMNGWEETPFTREEMWSLEELMATFYHLQKFAEICDYGGSNITTNPMRSELIDKGESKKINEILLPLLFKKVYEIVGEVYGVYAKTEKGMRLINKAFENVRDYDSGMVYTEKEALALANSYYKQTGNSAIIAKRTY